MIKSKQTKKLICELAGVNYESYKTVENLSVISEDFNLLLLTKAVFAINRDIEKGYFVTFVNGDQVAVYRNKCGMDFMKKLFSFERNGEVQALSSAVEYVVKEISND
jgi:hypothetical protein